MIAKQVGLVTTVTSLAMPAHSLAHALLTELQAFASVKTVIPVPIALHLVYHVQMVFADQLKGSMVVAFARQVGQDMTARWSVATKLSVSKVKGIWLAPQKAWVYSVLLLLAIATSDLLVPCASTNVHIRSIRITEFASSRIALMPILRYHGSQRSSVNLAGLAYLLTRIV